MARVLLALIVVVTVLVLVEARNKKWKEQKAKRCVKKIRKFEECLHKGYMSVGCDFGEGNLEDYELRKCRWLEKRVFKNCHYMCKPASVPELMPLPEITAEPEPEPEPEPKPEPLGTYDLKCKLPGFDFPGADIRSFKAESFEECAAACSKEAGCTSITARHSDHYCWLKEKRGGEKGPTSSESLSSMNLKCDRSLPDTSCVRNNMDFLGADLRHFPIDSLEVCAILCRDTQGCHALTLRKSDNYCWLKSKRGGQTGPSPNPELVSMNLNCAASSGFDPTDRTCAEDNTDYWGADLRNFKSTGYQNCRTSCFDAADCVSFTMRHSDNFCWLKTKKGGENGPKAVEGLISVNMEC